MEQNERFILYLTLWRAVKPHWWPQSLSSVSTCWASRWVTGSRAWWVLLLTPSVSKQTSRDDALCLLPRWNVDFYLDIFNTPLALNAPGESCQEYLLLLHFYRLPAVFRPFQYLDKGSQKPPPGWIWTFAPWTRLRLHPDSFAWLPLEECAKRFWVATLRPSAKWTVDRGWLSC